MQLVPAVQLVAAAAREEVQDQQDRKRDADYPEDGPNGSIAHDDFSTQKVVGSNADR
jgi:hypothetical protein